ncbi:hypothetical protein C8J56DRAFT_759951, partial [Mycena floridula]
TEKETKEDEIITGVHQEYLKCTLDKIKSQITRHSQPDCYRDGTFWIRPRDAVFALNAAKVHEDGVNPNELYQLPIFVWFPDMLPDTPDTFLCSCGHYLSRNGMLSLLLGYNQNPIARRVRDLLGDYFLLRVRFRCDEKTKVKGCGRSYQATDPHIIQQLPRHIQEAFPAFLTERAAADKSMVAVMRSTFANRFGPEPFASLMGEMRYLQHAQRELIYLSTCLSHPPLKPQSFSKYDDPLRYNGKHPSNQYCKAVFVDWMREHSVFFDRAMACLPGGILKGDHTFKVAKYISCLSGEPAFEAMYTLVNEWEEIRAQSLTISKSLSVVQDMISDVSKGLEAHGHPPTYQMYTDNAKAELTFHESTTASLAKDVVHIDADPYSALSKLTVPAGFSFNYYEAPDLIDAACLRIIEALPQESSQRRVIGLDILFSEPTETLPEGRAARAEQIDVLSISTSEEVYIFKVSKYLSYNELPPCLRSLILSKQIVKVGYDVQAQFRRIARAWPHQQFHNLLDMDDPPYLDLVDLARLKGKVLRSNPTLESLCGRVLERRIVKANKLRISPWCIPELSKEHKDYAQLRVYSCWRIYSKLSKYPSVGLSVADLEPGVSVSLHSGKKLVAYGIIAPQSPSLAIPLDPPINGATTKVINITTSRALVEITNVLVPDFIVSLHGSTLSHISSLPGPFHVVVSKRSLQTAAAEHTDMESFPQRAEIQLPSTASFVIEDGMDSDGSDSESDSGSESNQIVDPSTMNILEPQPEEFPMSPGSAAMFLDPSLDPPQLELQQPEALAAGDALATRISDDIFHFENRLTKLLPKSHSAFKAFSREFADTVLVYDAADKEAVEKSLQRRGLSWEWAHRIDSDGISQRVRKFCPPPERLVPDLEHLFESWQDVECTTDPNHIRLFSAAARRKATTLIDTARRGLISDPPGHPLYQRIGVDPDGLVLYKCQRGTSSLEGGVHMPVRRGFGPLSASPELGDALLCAIRLRRNERVGCYSRTGKKFRGHYDIWICDLIVELAQESGVKPSFPLPAVLSTRIVTNESFGITQVPKSIASKYELQTVDVPIAEGIPTSQHSPIHLLTHLSTAPVSSYDFLKQRQQTMFALTPVHTAKESQKFTELMNSGQFTKITQSHAPSANNTAKTVDFDRLAKHWNHDLNFATPSECKGIYYKVPEQLERYHKRWVAYRAEKATLLTSQEQRRLASNMLKDPRRVAHVLPA